MTISLKTRAMLWGRAAQRCAFPECRIELVKDVTQTDDESLVGEDCHIIAQSENGPRGVLTLTNEEKIKYSNLIEKKDTYNNLILLCNVHHKQVDDQYKFYTVENLLNLKSVHEKWVRDSLQDFDEAKQRDYEIYSSYIEEWMKRIEIDEWTNWASWLLCPEPCISKKRLNSLSELQYWLLSRVWTRRCPPLESAFVNFRLVLNDFIKIFKKHADNPFDEDVLYTEKFYKTKAYNPFYNEQLREYEFHIDLLHDLVIEMTRAANYLCDRVRQYVEPSFRLNEGVLIIVRSDALFKEVLRPEYIDEQRTDVPYENLEKFKIERSKRDYYVGSDSQ